MSSREPRYVRVAKAIGVFTSLFLVGQTAASSYLVLPCIMQSPASLLARQWQTMHNHGASIGIPGCLACTAVFSWLASREHVYTHTFKFYSFAAILSPCIIPYTFLFLRPLNAKLGARASVAMASATKTDIEEQKYQLGRGDEPEPVDGETVHELVDRWGWWNLGRAAISATASLCALWAAVGEA